MAEVGGASPFGSIVEIESHQMSEETPPNPVNDEVARMVGYLRMYGNHTDVCARADKSDRQKREAIKSQGSPKAEAQVLGTW